MNFEIKQLVLAIQTIAEEKNIDKDAVHDIVQQALAAAWRRDHGDKDQDVRVKLNEKTGDLQVFSAYEVVEEVENEHAQMTLEEARKIRKNAELGETIEIKEDLKEFGRVAAQTAKQVILQKLREAEREVILEEYEDKIGTVLNGTVTRVESRLVRIDLGKAQGILPQSEQIQGEYYSIGNRLKVFLKEVERTNRGPQLILSRGNAEFISYLFSNEVPEMENGAVEIKAIAREAGIRTKIAVHSTVPGVDPVGTFVGGHGTRVQAVMSEIGDQEKIDIIMWNEDIVKFISNALAPTEVQRVELDEKNKKATVFVREDQLSIAIGRGGQNVRLASKLTDWEIDITSVDNRKKEEAPATQHESSKPAEEKTQKKRLVSKSELEDALLNAVEEHGEEAEQADKPVETDASVDEEVK